MNIVVRSHKGDCFVRPDTTRDRYAEDFYPPEFVSRLDYTPVLFANISKPGRSISRKFASRYFDSIGFGILLYPGDMLDGSPASIARASCLDHTSFLTPPSETVASGNGFTQDNCIQSIRISKNGETIFEPAPDILPTGRDIVDAIAETSKYVHLRFGDIIAIELDEIKPLCRKEEDETSISISFNGRVSEEFRIIF